MLRTPHLGKGVCLVWEPWAHNHGEVVPGYAHCLRELGHEVSVLVSPGRIKEGLLSRMQDPGIHLNSLSQTQIRRLLKYGDCAHCAGLPRDLRPWFRGLGRIDFAQLFDEVEAADFILTAYQDDNPDHLFYRTAGTSGNFQLVYGFRKPCVLLREFAAIQGFDEGNSVLYEGTEDLGDGMPRAARLPAEQYGEMQRRLDATASALAQSSLDNLRALLAADRGPSE
ncbi:MAG: hypothetical protein MEQ07_10960 [Aquimonas sp.]|nr:hypothetical protein [Aquimonas sp.]